MFLPHPRVKVSIVGGLRDRAVACSASDHQGSNFESCVWRTVSSQSSHHPQEVLLAQLSLYMHKSGLKPDSFHFYSPLKYLLVPEQHSIHSWVKFFIFLHTPCVILQQLFWPQTWHYRPEKLTFGAIITVLKQPSPGLNLGATDRAKESTRWPEYIVITPVRHTHTRLHWYDMS